MDVQGQVDHDAVNRALCELESFKIEGKNQNRRTNLDVVVLEEHIGLEVLNGIVNDVVRGARCCRIKRENMHRNSESN